MLSALSFELQCLGALLGHNNSESTALAGLTVDIDASAQFHDEGIADVEAQAGPFSDGFGGEEGIEEVLSGFFIHAAAVVADLDRYPTRPDWLL